MGGNAGNGEEASCRIVDDGDDDDDLSKASFDLQKGGGGVVHNFGKCNGHWGDGRGVSNFSLGRAASEDMGEDLNVGLVEGHFRRAK